MKNGSYTLRFNCDGYTGTGRLEVDVLTVKGGDSQYTIEGQLAEAGRNVIAALTIGLAPGVSGNSKIRGSFSCAMTGTSSEESFSLYGIGPLGLIIEIDGQWAGSIENRRGDRRQASDAATDV